MSILAGYAVPHPPLIIPAVGRGEQRAIQATIDSYERVAREIASLAPDVIIVSSPHAPAFYDGFFIAEEDEVEGTMSRFYAPQERVAAACDTELVQAVIAAAHAEGIPAGSFGRGGLGADHGSFIPLWFIARGCELPSIMIMGLSGFDAATHFELGRIVAREAAALGRRAVWVASGDLSHKLKADGPYGLSEEGPIFDERICEIFASGELELLAEFTDDFAERAAECGLRSFELMAGALEGSSYTSELLSHEGTFGVGYGVAAFRVEGE